MSQASSQAVEGDVEGVVRRPNGTYVVTIHLRTPPGDIGAQVGRPVRVVPLLAEPPKRMAYHPSSGPAAMEK